MLARVAKVTDPLRFVIEATAKGVIENVKAYPINNDDEPKVGEEVLLFELETEFGYSYLYRKLRLDPYTKFEFGNNIIQMTKDGGVTIRTKSGNEVSIDSSGDIDIESSKTVTIKAKNIRIKAANSFEVDAQTIKFPKGTVSGTGAGPFNSIPTCPYSTAIHQGNILKKG